MKVAHFHREEALVDLFPGLVSGSNKDKFMAYVIKNAWVITMEDDAMQWKDGALVIVEDRIDWIGATAQLPSCYETFDSIDAAGKLVLPGFVNSHTHAALSVLRGVGDDIGLAPAYSPKVPQGVFMSDADCYHFSLLGAGEALLFGSTTIVDNYLYIEQTAQASKKLGIRAVLSERLHNADLFKIPENRYAFSEQIGQAALQRAVDFIEKWEGAEEGRIRCRFGPHAPDTCSADYLKQIRELSEQSDLGVVIHNSQSQREMNHIQEREGCSPTEYLSRSGLLNQRLIAGHCIYVSQQDMVLLSQGQAHVSHLSDSNAKNGMMAPVNELQDRGVSICLGTDNMTGNMIETMKMAVCTARMLTRDYQALRAMDVLKMATINGAKALQMEEEIGSLKVGKKADIVIINMNALHNVPIVDPIANLVFNGLGSDVETVFVDGKLVVDQGQLVNVDEKALEKEVQQRCENLWCQVSAVDKK
ncbi:MAG: amidohydrolase [Anaerolineaceae bacterium]|jgi:5-methylthioadenosine/S-adenosylhomocysteine deaminase|nr:amidohydrolase [Anaerolineaceae bacterium]